MLDHVTLIDTINSARKQQRTDAVKVFHGVILGIHSKFISFINIVSDKFHQICIFCSIYQNIYLMSPRNVFQIPALVRFGDSAAFPIPGQFLVPNLSFNRIFFMVFSCKNYLSKGLPRQKLS